MALILNTKLDTDGVIAVTTLGASDTAVVDLAKKTTLVVNNITAGALTLNVVGDTATSTECAGVGVIDLTGGVTAAIGVGEVYNLPLNPAIQKWLGDGNITITGGDGAEAYILEV